MALAASAQLAMRTLPPFPGRPPRAPVAGCVAVGPELPSAAAEAESTQRPGTALSPGPPPSILELRGPWPGPSRRAASEVPELTASLRMQRSRSAGPPPCLPALPEEGDGWRHEVTRREQSLDEARRPAPVLRNLAAFERPQAYAAALRGAQALQRPAAVGGGCGRRAFRSPVDAIDEAIQRELIGDGIALDEAVASRAGAGWAVKQRHLQKSDVGHCCHGCRQPLRDLSEEVTVWTGAAIYRRFHPACAASYVLRADGQSGGGSSGSSTGAAPSGSREDIVEGYADGWRAPRAGRPAVEAARRWLLSRDPRAWPSLRGDLFTTVTVVAEDGQKKAVPGLSHDQLKTLQTQHRWQPASGDSADATEPECAICFGPPEPGGPPCVRLPCAPQQHVFHVACVLPWLRKASLCPTCRQDLRPLLSTTSGSRQAALR